MPFLVKEESASFMLQLASKEEC